MKWIDIEEFKSHIRIEEVISKHIYLHSIGMNSFKGKCPFHQEKVASFTVYTDSQQYHCFGCGVHGDVFKFIMEYENVDFERSVEILKSFI